MYYIDVRFHRGVPINAYCYVSTPTRRDYPEDALKLGNLRAELDERGTLQGINIMVPIDVDISQVNYLLQRYNRPTLDEKSEEFLRNLKNYRRLLEVPVENN